MGELQEIKENFKEDSFNGHWLSGYQIQWLIERVERCEKALSFYANKDYYEPFRNDEEDRTDAFNFIDLDGGETAREALDE